MMKPELRGRIALFRLDESHYDDIEAKKAALTIRSLGTNIRGLNVKAILVSLKDIPDLEQSALLHFFRVLNDFEKSLDVVTGICAYDNKVFTRSKENAKKYHISLFKTLEIAAYMLKEKNISKESPVCVLAEDELEFELIKMEVEARGNRFVSYDNEEHFLIDKRQNKDAFYIHKSYFDFLHNKTVSRLEEGAVIFELQERLGKKIETLFPYSLFGKRLKEGFKLYVMDARSVEFFDNKAVEYFISLSLMSSRFDALIVFLGLKPNIIARAVSESMKKAHILFFDTKKELFSDQAAMAALKTRHVERGELNRKLIGNLPVFINAAIDTFSSFVGGEAKKISHKIDGYDDAFMGASKYFGSTIEFTGELDGSLMLMFSLSLINQISEVLLGAEPADEAETEDVLKEFLNIVSGSAKTMLSKKDVSVTISIPKTFGDKEALFAYSRDKKGVLVNMHFEDYPLQLFLIP